MMYEAFIAGLLQVLSWPPFGFLLLGAFVGFVVGILPGLGGLATLALMLPFAYKIQEPISAFSFLLGMHAITGTTGDLTSILFGIPGEGTAAATIMDGYPMTKNGEAGRAMGCCPHELSGGGARGRADFGSCHSHYETSRAFLRFSRIVHARYSRDHLHRCLERFIFDKGAALRRYRTNAGRVWRRSHKPVRFVTPLALCTFGTA